jgi:hypothetical protein
MDFRGRFRLTFSPSRGGGAMTKIQIELPEATAKAARDAGLLTPKMLERLFRDAIKRREATDRLLSIADRVADAGIAPMSVDQVNAEVKAARVERRSKGRQPTPQ